jgi:hypothetical protein
MTAKPAEPGILLWYDHQSAARALRDAVPMLTTSHQEVQLPRDAGPQQRTRLNLVAWWH